MTISLLKDVPAEALKGKYICAPSVLSFQDFGYPAIIEKVTAQRLSYRKLARGAWDADAKEWRVNPDLDQAGDEECRMCNIKSIDLVCDTVEEAIALFEYSRANRKKIETVQTALLKDVRDRALSATLPSPGYLVD